MNDQVKGSCLVMQEHMCARVKSMYKYICSTLSFSDGSTLSNSDFQEGLELLLVWSVNRGSWTLICINKWIAREASLGKPSECIIPREEILHGPQQLSFV